MPKPLTGRAFAPVVAIAIAASALIARTTRTGGHRPTLGAHEADDRARTRRMGRRFLLEQGHDATPSSRLRRAGPAQQPAGVDSDAGDSASYLRTISGPIVLVAHSYGGMVITNAATDNKQVRSLVHVDAFIPAEGQTLASLNHLPRSSPRIRPRSSTSCHTQAPRPTLSTFT
jgi:hypothetical protein